MKKGILSLAIMLITIALLITTTNASFTANVSMKSDSTTTKVGDTVTLTISVNEKVIASNFDISYDSTILKLEGSGTSNLSVAEKDGKIACIYADMSGIGTSEFKVKFKALKETTATSLKIENAKFRAEGQDESYTGEQITGINNAITVKVQKVESSKEETSPEPSTGNQVEGKDKTTTKTTNLPKAGKETGVVIAGIAVLVIIAVAFGKKSKELSKIFSSLSVFVIAFVMVTSLNKNVYAVLAETTITVTPTNTEQPEQFGSGVLSNGEKYIGILINKSDSDRKIKTAYLTEVAQGIIQVLNDKKEQTSNDGQDLVKTGYYLTKDDGEYKIIIYGDANADGIVCDTDDLMIIINDYLGKKEATELEKIAANLDARDDVLDSDDLMQMINMYLGKLNNDLVVENIDIVGKWQYTSAMKNGEEVTLVDVFGTSAIGTDNYLDFGMDGTFMNNFPGATSSEFENNGKYTLYGKNIKLQIDNKIVNLTYNSSNNTISYPYGEYILILKTKDQVELEQKWEYEISDSGIILNKYIGEDKDVTVKSNYKIGDKDYYAKLAKTEVKGYNYDGSGSLQYTGPFMKNTIIENVTFEKVYDDGDVLGTDVSNLFYGCTNLKRVIGFEGNMTNMKGCFEGCISLINETQKTSPNYVEGAEIVIPDSVINLDYAFTGCTSIEYLPSIGINSKLETANEAFAGCNKAHSGIIYLNSTVTDITRMFYGCKFLGYYSGKGFYIYSNINIDNISTTYAFDNCGYETGGASGYGSQPHEIIVLNATSTSDRNYQFFVELLQNSQYCDLDLKLSE